MCSGTPRRPKQLPPIYGSKIFPPVQRTNEHSLIRTIVLSCWLARFILVLSCIFDWPHGRKLRFFIRVTEYIQKDNFSWNLWSFCPRAYHITQLAVTANHSMYWPIKNKRYLHKKRERKNQRGGCCEQMEWSNDGKTLKVSLQQESSLPQGEAPGLLPRIHNT